MIHTLNSWERRIACVTHPDAVGVVESEKFGGIRTEVGPVGYVLQSGERIEMGGPNKWAHVLAVGGCKQVAQSGERVTL